MPNLPTSIPCLDSPTFVEILASHHLLYSYIDPAILWRTVDSLPLAPGTPTCVCTDIPATLSPRYVNSVYLCTGIPAPPPIQILCVHAQRSHPCSPLTPNTNTARIPAPLPLGKRVHRDPWPLGEKPLSLILELLL